MYRMLCSTNRVLYQVLKVLVMTLLCAMSGMVFMQVIFRYVLNRPLAWSEELATYLFSWLAYFGAAVVLRTQGHVCVSSFVEAIKDEKKKRALKIFSQVLILAFLAIIAVISMRLSLMVWNNDQRLINLHMIKVGLVFMQVPFSALCMGLFTVEYIGELCGMKKGNEEGEKQL